MGTPRITFPPPPLPPTALSGMSETIISRPISTLISGGISGGGNGGGGGGGGSGTALACSTAHTHIRTDSADILCSTHHTYEYRTGLRDLDKIERLSNMDGYELSELQIERTVSKSALICRIDRAVATTRRKTQILATRYQIPI